MRPLFSIFALSLGVLCACEVPPPDIERPGVDQAIAMSRFKTACVGLRMKKDDDLRAYTAKKLAEIPDQDVIVDCVCENAYKADKHTVDLAIVKGLESSARDDLAQCFVPALADAEVKDRAALIAGLVKVRAPALSAELLRIAQDATQASDVRAAAFGALGGTSDAGAVSTLVSTLKGDPAAEVRAAAATALVGQKDPAVADALYSSATTDADGAVRAAALASLRTVGSGKAEQVLCELMIKDPAPAVRKEAILAMKGAKSDTQVACLRERALTKEDDPDVRQAILTALGSSPNQKAADALCEAVPFFMKSYITKEPPEKVPGTDIAKAQNDRDFEKSYECFERALRQKGQWSCVGQQYVAWWFNEVGGKAFIPKCDGGGSGGGGGGKEIVF
ncbi:MAG: HEAT repeat domain-containing protein [Deltaproteobacteria bacterium]|nr:HEAT repeat domain-containing protein [Deltaproteobacteria bacterium]MBK9365021.1 HEAT repeat domain-containing protein [Deltaproteobacteria bacterium]